MPARNLDLHGNVPDSSRVALVLIDVIDDLEFPEGRQLLRHALPMARRLAAFKRKVQKAGIPAIYVNDNFGKWQSDFRKLIDHCLNDGVAGRPIVELLQPAKDDYFVLKPKHSGFFSTTLDTLLDYLGVETLVLSGIAGNSCVFFTANDAYMRDYHLIIPADCVASNTKRDNDHALEQMKKILKADTTIVEVESARGVEAVGGALRAHGLTRFGYSNKYGRLPLAKEWLRPRPMNDFWQDPRLNELVKELNETAESKEPSRTLRTPRLSAAPLAADPTGALGTLLTVMIERGASDLLIIPGSRPILRINGALEPFGDSEFSSGDIGPLFTPWFDAQRLSELETRGSMDFSIRYARRRLRINVHRQRGDLAAAIRSSPAEIPTLEQLTLPPQLARLIEPASGLVLVCGPTGSGKSSTLAALVGEINRRFTRHIVTIEDPVEYEHVNNRSVIEQIEIGVDAPSFGAAMRSILRQNPEVILVGEMRDLETIATAITAAETGHLILGTLHTGDATQALNRLVDVFPAVQQAQVRHQLSLSLSAIVSQQLLPRTDKTGRVPALELLIANDAVRNHIRSERLQNLPSEITLGKRIGMVSLEESLAALVRRGVVTAEEARRRSRRPEEFESVLRQS